MQVTARVRKARIEANTIQFPTLRRYAKSSYDRRRVLFTRGQTQSSLSSASLFIRSLLTHLFTQHSRATPSSLPHALFFSFIFHKCKDTEPIERPNRSFVCPCVHSRGRALFRYRLVALSRRDAARRGETRRGEARQRDERKRDERKRGGGEERRARFLATGCQGPPGPRAAPVRLPRGPVRRRGWLP